MVREHHVAVLQVNHVSILCMRLHICGGFYIQYTYIIGPEAQLRNTSDHASISQWHAACWVMLFSTY